MQECTRNHRYHSFSEFWLYYVGEHKNRLTRIIHFAGTLTIIPLLFVSVLINLNFLFLIPVFGYGLAWCSHFFIEKNRPATFSYPLWSLAADFKMFGMMVAGKMDQEVIRCRKLRAA